ncbi:hypothetical protein KC318_g1372 [Hortaea werneckii]|nr:hypothetical protein KC334_g3802 [Hortaea werneckii]KAI7015562.1 hypothetical protein KC355_g4297 [Hortaea werneckii]KAI7674774.1 hypothetical protein KC318_g1372 [Hortaea werneckii]
MPRVFKPSSDSASASALCAHLNNVSKYQVIQLTCVAPCTSGCKEDCVGGDATLLSNYVSPHGKDEVPLDEIDNLLALVYCSKHVAEYKCSLGRILIGTDLDNLKHPSDSSGSMYHFGSHEHANPDCSFSFSVSGQASDPPSVDSSNVSDTRRLDVYSGGQKEVYKVDPEAASPAPSLAVSSPEDLDKAVFDTPTPGTPRLKSRNAGDPSTPPAQASLSPGVSREDVYPRANRHRSERARTPSPAHSSRLSDRGRWVWATMRGDVSYESPPACNQKRVLETIGKPLQYSDARIGEKTGSVYVVRDPELDLVKIGYTTASVSHRVREIRSQCRASSQQWQIEHDDSNTSIFAYRRLEKLVHDDLAPHRWFFLCECGSAKRNANRVTEHQEWFDVSPEIAIKTVKLWRSFLLRDPYGEPLKNTDMPLKGPWNARIKEYKEADCKEKHEDHETRLVRWRTLLGIEDPHEPTKVPKQEEPEASITKIKSEPVEEDLATTFMNVPQKAREDSPIPSIEPATVAEPPSSAPEIFGDLDSGAQTPKFHEHATPSQITPSSGEAAPSASASAAAAEDQAKADTQYEDSKQDCISTHKLDATSQVVHHGEKLLITLLAVLDHKRPPIPERTIMEDLTALRWPLGCAVAFALHTPYVPPLLSAMLWTIFLPSLVAELRGWML